MVPLWLMRSCGKKSAQNNPARLLVNVGGRRRSHSSVHSCARRFRLKSDRFLSRSTLILEREKVAARDALPSSVVATLLPLGSKEVRRKMDNCFRVQKKLVNPNLEIRVLVRLSSPLLGRGLQANLGHCARVRHRIRFLAKSRSPSSVNADRVQVSRTPRLQCRGLRV